MTGAPPESLLVRYVSAHVRKGEQAKERADQAGRKSDEHFVAAGRYLKLLKETYCHGRQEWELLLNTKVKVVHRSRADELIAIADGRKTLEETREETAQRVRT